MRSAFVLGLLKLGLTANGQEAGLTWQGGTLGGATGGGGGPTWLLAEDFEGSNGGFDLAGWSAVNVLPNPDYTVHVLSGTQSCALTNLAQCGAGHTYSAPSSTNYFYIQLFLLNYPSSGHEGQFVEVDGSGYNLALKVTETGRIRLQDTGSDKAITNNGMATNTLYNVWFAYCQGSGANGFAFACFDSSSTRPTAGNQYCSYASMSGATAPATFYLYNGAQTYTQVVIDRVRIDDVPIDTAP